MKVPQGATVLVGDQEYTFKGDYWTYRNDPGLPAISNAQPHIHRIYALERRLTEIQEYLTRSR